MRIRSNRLAVVVVLAVCLGLGAWVVWRFYNAPSTVIVDGKVVQDVPVAEAGAFAGSRFAPVRKAYLSNLEVYRSIETEASSDRVNEVAERIHPVLVDRLKKVAAQRQGTVARIVANDAAIRDLSKQVAIVLARASGMGLDDYKGHLADDMALVVPENLPPSERQALGLAESAASSTEVVQDELRRAFERCFLAANSARSGQGKLASWSLREDGFKVAIAEAPTGTSGSGVLFESMNARDKELFRGLLAQASLIFHRSPETQESLKRKYPAIVYFEAATIAEDALGDRFPLWMTLYYDPDRSRWWIVNVYRMVSVRAANAPPLAY